MIFILNKKWRELEMQKIKFLVSLCLLLIAGGVNAQQQVSEKEARIAALNTLRNSAEVLKRSSDTEIDTVHSFSKNRSDVLMYEVVFKNGAAVLLSGSKACLPVLGYYTKPEHDKGAIFDTTNTYVPCCLHDFLYDYIQEIEWSFAQKDVELYHETAWNELQQSGLLRANSTAFYVVPLLQTQWNQNFSNDFSVYNGTPISGACDAYNYFAPNGNGKCSCSLNGGVKCPAGCVAVAMAQIMKYWNYPVYFVNYYQYDWCNMPNELRTTSPNYEKERNAIARLIKDCGDAVDMKYCRQGECKSGTTDSKARKALVNHFGYSNDADLQRRFWSSSLNTWKERIKNNLDKGYPVYYSGSGSGGHAFVCDGYISVIGDYFHFNWGWGGSYDDLWVTLDNLTPGNSNYNSGQHAIFHIRPSTNQDYCDFTYPLWDHYNIWNNIFGYPISYAHQIVPKTLTVLESVPSEQGYPTSWHTIESGQTAEYVAHESITLKPGFHAKAGSNFTARIEPCNSCTQFSKITVTENGEELEVAQTMSHAIEKITDTQSEEKIDEKMMDNDFYLKLYPNPSAGDVTIEYTINKSEFVEILLHDNQGKLVYKLKNNSTHDSGVYQITLGGAELPAGIYYCTLQTENKRATEKLIIFK